MPSPKGSVWRVSISPAVERARARAKRLGPLLPCLALGGLGVLVSASPLYAEDCAAPCAGYAVEAELQNDFLFAADPPSLRSDVVQPTVTSDYYLIPVDHLKLLASIISEPVADPPAGEDAAFHGLGTYAGELYAALAVAPLAMRAGKFDTIFSLISDVDPGLNDANLASAFDADERWGVETAVAFDAFDIHHRATATVFTSDRSFLSGSLFTDRGRTRLSDGGAGNTQGLSSFAITLDGCKGAEPGDCFDEGAFGYRLGLRLQRAGHATAEQRDEGRSPRSEQAVLAAGTANFAIADGMELRLMGETAYLHHFEGDADDTLIVTALAALDHGPLRYVAAYTHQRNFGGGEPGSDEQLIDVEAIYLSGDDRPLEGNSWTVGAAYSFLQTAEHQDSHVFTLRATFALGGEVEFGK